MRTVIPNEIELARIVHGPYGSSPVHRMNGAFRFNRNGVILCVISNDATEWKRADLPHPAWEHVSVSNPNRCPTWDEMEFIKRLFWDDDETVIQLHVPVKEHISHHDHCLHLWKPVGIEIPRPPKFTIA